MPASRRTRSALRTPVIGLFLLAALVLVAYFGGKPKGSPQAGASAVTTAAQTTQATKPPAKKVVQLASLSVHDITAPSVEDRMIDLASLQDGSSKLFVWFWSPHCPACRTEAPEVLELARQTQGKLRIVGIGSQDDLERARAFVASTNVEFTMLWDETGESWNRVGLTVTPSSMLLDADGTLLGSWVGPFPREVVASMV